MNEEVLVCQFVKSLYLNTQIWVNFPFKIEWFGCDTHVTNKIQKTWQNKLLKTKQTVKSCTKFHSFVHNNVRADVLLCIQTFYGNVFPAMFHSNVLPKYVIWIQFEYSLNRCERSVAEARSWAAGWGDAQLFRTGVCSTTFIWSNNNKADKR